MEDVQKNENGTTAQQADGKPKKENKPKRELTPQQVQQRRKMIVFPLMFLAFAGCMYLIFENHKRKSTCCRKKIRSHKGAAVLLQGRLTGTSTAS